MAVTILSAGGISGSNSASTLDRTTERLKESSTSSSKISVFEEASTVKLSKSEQARNDATSQALRNLSLAKSFVDVAAGATSEVNRLVNDSIDLAKEITNEVNPNRRQELSSEAASLISAIDSVATNATVNGFATVDAGPQTFQFNMTPGDTTSDHALQLTIANVGISRSDLGLDSIDSSSFDTDNENTIDTLESAQVQLTNVAASLKSANSDVKTVAQHFGIQIENDVRNQTGEENATRLAENISKSIKDSQLLKTNNLDPIQVIELIQDDSASTTQDTPA